MGETPTVVRVKRPRCSTVEGQNATSRVGWQKVDEACKAGSAQGCAILGTALLMGLGGKKEIERGAKLLGNLCQVGDPGACLKYAAALVDGRGVDKDIKTAREILDRTCEAGIKPACEMRKHLPKK